VLPVARGSREEKSFCSITFKVVIRQPTPSVTYFSILYTHDDLRRQNVDTRESLLAAFDLVPLIRRRVPNRLSRKTQLVRAHIKINELDSEEKVQLYIILDGAQLLQQMSFPARRMHY